MPAVRLPAQIRELLRDSPFEPAVLSLADAVGSILNDNKTPFFPAFTDHGTQHVERVLAAAIRLIPTDVWESSLLNAADGAVLACGTMLHDLAMHVREAGFVELVRAETRYGPLAWFAQHSPGRPADIPWPELWTAFQHEARHFGTSHLELILGPAGRTVPDVAYETDLHPDGWTKPDRLLIGEFLRRHHARLSHEIAVYGFPGADAPEFPILAETTPQLANAIGALARSHGEPLRRMLQYLDYLEPGSQRPSGSLLAYHMGLLRVADYLQVEADRAPPLLLMLKMPQSPLSIEEWNKHGAVMAVSWDHRDPFAIFVSISPHHGIRTHLALDALFHDLQRELDTTTAVLSEVYGGSELAALRLSRQRVLTNLAEPSLHNQLPYLPRRAVLRSDTDLFRLVVRDLYGNQPAVAGRELIQNAVDAVRAVGRWERQTGDIAESLEYRSLAADVVVTIDEGPDGCELRVADRGIGMTPDLVVNYFLQAGASFGPTVADLEELTEDETLRVMKTGRFGVGAFAAFLLGPELRVVTRHVSQDRAVAFRARLDEDLVELRWVDAPVGTEIVVPFDSRALPKRRWADEDSSMSLDELIAGIAYWYRLTEPRVVVARRNGDEEQEVAVPADVPVPRRKLPDRWRNVRAPGFDAVLWRVPPRSRYASGEGFHSGHGPLLAHNGIVVHTPDPYSIDLDETYTWADARLRSLLRCPSLAVFDARHLLGVALHRYSLVDQHLPFESELLQAIGADILAHALTMGARNHPLQDDLRVSPVFMRTSWLPLLPDLVRRFTTKDLLVLWRPYEDSRRPLADANAHRYCAKESGISWAQWPHRTVLFLESPGQDDYEYDFDEIRTWGYTPETIWREARAWQTRLGARSRLSILMRRGGDHRTRVTLDVWGGDGESQWRDFKDGLVSREADVNDDTRQQRKLIEAARVFLADGAAPSVALTAYGDFEASNAAHEAVAAAWARILRGALDRGPRKRQRIADALAAEHRSLRPLINKWRRLGGTSA
jgi:molecular chaperone HtpG